MEGMKQGGMEYGGGKKRRSLKTALMGDAGRGKEMKSSGDHSPKAMMMANGKMMMEHGEKMMSAGQMMMKKGEMMM